MSKYGHFVLIKHPYSARSVADVFAKEVIRLHGIPISIVSDRDPTFMSHLAGDVPIRRYSAEDVYSIPSGDRRANGSFE